MPRFTREGDDRIQDKLNMHFTQVENNEPDYWVDGKKLTTILLKKISILSIPKCSPFCFILVYAPGKQRQPKHSSLCKCLSQACLLAVYFCAATVQRVHCFYISRHSDCAPEFPLPSSVTFITAQSINNVNLLIFYLRYFLFLPAHTSCLRNYSVPMYGLPITYMRGNNQITQR